ncbi:MAG: YcaO-like family protein, partial [Caldimicrobium sp.]
ADKALFPEETIKIVEERLRSCQMRVYKGLKRIDKGRLGIPVYISLYDVDGTSITGNFKQMGKGASDILSQASALVELVERFSLFRLYKEAHKKGIFGTFEKLNDKAMPWEEFIKSVEDEEDLRSKEVALRILKKVPFYFVPALEVRTKEVKYIPFHWFWLIYEYNGSAGGNTYPEAAVQAICELIERHTNAYSIRWNKPMPGIRRESIKGSTAEELVQCYERLGIKLWIRDMTFGMPVPTIAVMAMDPSTFPHRSEIVYAAGTGTSPERALIRALTEVAQLAGDFDTEGKYLESGLPKFSTLEEAKVITEMDGEKNLQDLPNLFSNDHVIELTTLSEKMKELGYEIYLIDLEEENLRLPAVYAIIPGILFRERNKIPYLYQLVRTIPLYMAPQERLSLLEEILKEVEDKFYLWAYYGNTLKELGKMEEAIFAYEKALQLEPSDPDKVAIYTHLADAYFKKENWEEVIKHCERAMTLGEVPEIFNLLGRAFYRKGDYPNALQAFLRATELDPSSAIDYANAGYCLKAMNFIPPAELFFRKALALDPNLTMAKRGLEFCESLLQNKN